MRFLAVTTTLISITLATADTLRGLQQQQQQQQQQPQSSPCDKASVAKIRNPEASHCRDSVCGTVTFGCAQARSKLTEITYDLTGLTPGKHALHVHENPVKGNCLSTGGHWNPTGEDHGGNLSEQRHIGDLGNILADATGSASGTLLAYVPLWGDYGISGRAVVVHEGADDLGLGGDDGSRAVGNAGARPGCGTIR